MDLTAYQEHALSTDQQPITGNGTDGSEVLVPLLGLARETGEILSEYKKHLRDGASYKLFRGRISEELGDLLWYLANVATKFGLDLNDVAEENLLKCRERWGDSSITQSLDPIHRSAFDSQFSEKERLPRQLNIEIIALEEGGSRIQTFVNGKKFGDDLTDNAYSADGYRFHDVFHLAHASVLGWSPVTRALLKRKRKSQPRVDEIEDGGRAIVVEEGIVAMVFSYAERHNFLEGAESVSYDLLRTIKGMTAHLEVSLRTAGEWERAIMLGFEAWREIRKSGRGRIMGEADRGAFELA